MITLGIDPDVGDMSFALWGASGPLAAEVVHVVRRKGGEQSQVRMSRELERTSVLDALAEFHVASIAIEGQQVDGRKARPKDLFTLAHATGSAIHWCVERIPRASIVVPTPTEWKGGVAKHAMQARMYVDLGWDYVIVGSGTSKYARPLHAPSRFSHITAGQWKHVGDALLLARWAQEQ